MLRTCSISKISHFPKLARLLLFFFFNSLLLHTLSLSKAKLKPLTVSFKVSLIQHSSPSFFLASLSFPHGKYKLQNPLGRNQWLSNWVCVSYLNLNCRNYCWLKTGQWLSKWVYVLIRISIVGIIFDWILVVKFGFLLYRVVYDKTQLEFLVCFVWFFVLFHLC